MKIEKETKIKNRVFKEDDILRLAQLFLDLKEEEKDWLKFEIKCKNGITLTGDSLDVFTSDYSMRQQINEISFWLSFRNDDRRVCVYLKDLSRDEWGINMLSIEGDDSQWFDRTCNVFKRYFDSVEQQSPFTRLLEYPYCIASGCGLYVFILGIVTIAFEMGLVYGDGMLTLRNAAGYALISIPICALLCLVCAPMIKWCFPSVEFRFKTRNGDARVGLKKAIAWIAGTIIIPVLLSFFLK